MNATWLLGMTATIAVVGTAALTGGASSSAADDASSERASARIVFTRGPDLLVGAGDGSGARLLARNAGQAAGSPDGRRIAFVRERSIWVMRRDGSHQRRLTKGSDDITPAWSPTGTTIYFARFKRGEDRYGGYVYGTAIFRIATDGGDLRQLTRPGLTDHGTCDESPAASPDGRVIAYASFGDCDHGLDPSISAIDAAGRRVDLAYDDIGSAFDPAWAPRGQTMAFATVDEWGSSTGIAVAVGDGSRARRVVRRPADEPTWSPDGRWLAFGSRDDVWIVQADGSGLRPLVRSAAAERDPVWLRPLR